MNGVTKIATGANSIAFNMFFKICKAMLGDCLPTSFICSLACATRLLFIALLSMLFINCSDSANISISFSYG